MSHGPLSGSVDVRVVKRSEVELSPRRSRPAPCPRQGFNRLTGELPAGLGLPSLLILRLNANRFTGPLPPQWGTNTSLPRLRVLSLQARPGCPQACRPAAAAAGTSAAAHAGAAVPRCSRCYLLPTLHMAVE